MVKERNLNNILLKSSVIMKIKKNTKIKKVVGFDTETEKGKCFLFGYYKSENEKGIKLIKNFDDILEIIMYREFRETHNFFYNITYDFQAIVKHLPIKNLKELSKSNKTIYKDCRILLIPNKCLIFRQHNNSIKFYDLAQFYNFNKLDTSAQLFLNMKKEELNHSEYEVDIKNLSIDRYEKDIKYKFYLDKYLYQDVRITQKLGEKLLELTKPYINPKSFYSQASFSQQYYLENLKESMNLPNKNIMQYGLNAYQGGRFEVFKRGFFPKAFIQDIKSAYPFHNSKVPNINIGKWKKEKEYDGNALIGLFKINVNIHDTKISPLKYQLHNGLMIYPTGKFKDIYVNKSELELLDDLGYKYKIESGFNYYDKTPDYPYKFLEKFYELKEKLKENKKAKELSWIPKIIMNGFYGKMIQMIEKEEYTRENRGLKNLQDIVLDSKGERIYVYKKFESGRLFNPIVANEITANTRVQLYRASLKKQDNIIGFQTDSIISDKKLDLNFDDKLGSWDMENEGEMIILGSGIYQILSESPKIRLRGFSKELDLYSILKENKENSNINITMLRNHKLKKTMKLKLTDEQKFKKFNLIENEIKSININFDRKRIWERDFFNCKDVLENQIESNPIII